MEKKADIEELVKPAKEKPESPGPVEEDEPVVPPVPDGGRDQERNRKMRLYGIGAGILVAVALGIAGINFLIKNIGNGTAVPTPTQAVTHELATEEVAPTSTPPPTLSEPLPASPVPTFGVGSVRTSTIDGMSLLFVPAGDFRMGSENGEQDEIPVHTVSLDAFWIDQTEVTNAMYAGCITAGGCNQPISTRSSTRESYFANPEFDDYPVLQVSWNDAKAYCEWAGRRLPTEAEWEKAAGWDEAAQSQRRFPWGDSSLDGSQANFCDVNCPREVKNSAFDDGFGDTAPAASYPAGASFYGAYDMAGNVWEWVEDSYDAYPGNTVGNSDFGTTFRVVRGGSWFFPNETTFRSANRAPNDPAQPNDAIGFRCALSE
jgi:serine/threonine-protein kinase